MLSNIVIGVMLVCLIFNFLHSPRSVHRTVLNVILIYWILILVLLIAMFNVEGFDYQFNGNVANMKLMILGIPSFLSLISYPIMAIHPNLVKLKYFLLFVLVLVIVPIIYFIWHTATGLDPFVKYVDFNDFINNITTTTVILRLLTAFSFIVFIVVSVMSIWQVVPLYNNYITDNVADNTYNVDWVRSYLILVVCVGVTYFLMLFVDSKYLNTLYLINLFFLFLYIVDRALFSKVFDGMHPLKIKWTRKLGWHVDESLDTTDNEEKADGEYKKYLADVRMKVDKWMDETQKYTNVEFTTNDIYVAFPDFSHNDIKGCLNLSDDTFQTYVRRRRITLACQIIKDNVETIYPKQLYTMVGFSHYSSFSRSFNTVMSESPSDFIKKVKESLNSAPKNAGGGGRIP